MKTEILQTVKEALHLQDASITEATRFDHVAHDSMAIVDVIVALSTKYELTIELEDLNDIQTLGDIANYVVQHRGNAAGIANPAS